LESKKLERGATLVYATESMRLTTRLMQVASWLLLHRAATMHAPSPVKVAVSNPVEHQLGLLKAAFEQDRF
jgi:hypothetical protein